MAELELVGGAFLRAVLGEVLGAVTEASIKAAMFKFQLKKLESTIKEATRILEQTEKQNKFLDIPKHETDELYLKLKQGELLLEKCSRVGWNCYKRIRYSVKLKKLDALIVRFIKVNLQLESTRDVKEALELARDTNAMVRRLSAKESNGFCEVKLGKPCAVPDPPEETHGFDEPLEELKIDLFKEGMQVIVVSAPGGSGKTTLVTTLCRDKEVKDKFKDNIFFVTVSQKPNVKVIVRKIMEHKNYFVPEFQTDDEAINSLKQMLREVGENAKPILLILDDVWSGSESMVENFICQLPNYKILVTSRSIFPRFACGHILNPLNKEAAMKLFRSSAMLPNGNSCFPDQETVNKILKACKGSPLALIVVGRSLSGQPAAFWESKANEWTQESTIFHSNTDLLDRLKISLDALDYEVKECYMDLGSFPEDQRIPVNTLIDMWMEFCTLVKNHNAIDNLFELSNRYLVNLVVTRKNASDGGFYNDHFVKQHDLLRELIIHESRLESIENVKRLFIDISGDNFPKWWLEQKQHPLKARLISISTDQTFSSQWYDMQAPNVEVVVLNIQSKKYTLPNFLKEMNKLKVLVVTNYGFFPSGLRNFEGLGSLPNLKRIRLEQVIITSFDMTTTQMENLLKISLVMCNVGQVFRNSTFHISYAFPNLEEIDIDYCNDLEELPNDLCELVCLKIISITNCHKLSRLPEGIGKLVNLQKLRLASCTDLTVLPNTIGNLSNLIFLDISECLSIKELPKQIGELFSLETLCMRGCSSCEVSRLNLKNLKVVKCDEETAINLKRFLPDLSKVTVEVVKEDINLNWLNNDLF